MSPGPEGSARGRRKVLATGGLAHAIHDGFTDCIYVLLPMWAAAFALTHTEVGALKLVMSGFLAATQVPAGIVAERYGERAVLVVGTVLAGVAYVLLGWAGGFLSLAAFLVVAGTGCGTQHPLVSAIISRAYPASGRRAALGTYNFTGDLGKVVAPAAVAAGAAAYGWPASAAAYGIFALCGAAALGALLPGRTASPGEAEPRPRRQEPKGWGITDRRGFAILSAIGMIDSGARLSFLTYLPFLLVEKGASIATIGQALALVFAGGAAGKLVCGHVAERAGILRTVVLTEAATTALIAAAILLPLDMTMAVLPLLGVALNGTSSVLYGTIGDFVEGDRQARAYGLFYTLGIGAGAVSPLVFGVVSDLWGVATALAAIAGFVVPVLPMCRVLGPRLRGADSERRLVLRPAKAEDSEFAFGVRAAAFGWDEGEERRRHERRFREQEFEVIEWEGEPAGIVALAMSEDCLWLKQICIAPSHQGRGIGGACLRRLLERAEKRGVPVRLQSLKVNPRALVFYERHGFRRTGETDTHYLLER